MVVTLMLVILEYRAGELYDTFLCWGPLWYSCSDISWRGMLVPQCFWPIRLTSVVLEHPIGAQPLHRPCHSIPRNSVLLPPCYLLTLSTNRMSSITFNRHLRQGTTPWKSHFVESKRRCSYDSENGIRNGAANQWIFLFFKINRGKHIKTLISLRSSLLKSFSTFYSYSPPFNKNTSSRHAHWYGLRALYSWPECQHGTSYLFPWSRATHCNCVVSRFCIYIMVVN